MGSARAASARKLGTKLPGSRKASPVCCTRHVSVFHRSNGGAPELVAEDCTRPLLKDSVAMMIPEDAMKPLDGFWDHHNLPEVTKFKIKTSRPNIGSRRIDPRCYYSQAINLPRTMFLDEKFWEQAMAEK